MRKFIKVLSIALISVFCSTPCNNHRVIYLVFHTRTITPIVRKQIDKFISCQRWMWTLSWLLSTFLSLEWRSTSLPWLIHVQDHNRILLLRFMNWLVLSMQQHGGKEWIYSGPGSSWKADLSCFFRQPWNTNYWYFVTDTNLNQWDWIWNNITNNWYQECCT